MTPFQEAITIVHRLKVWIADERMGDGALLKSAADLIERQQSELAEARAECERRRLSHEADQRVANHWLKCMREAEAECERYKVDAERLARGFHRLTKNMDFGELADYDSELASDTKELRPLAEAITFGLPRPAIDKARHD